MTSTSVSVVIPTRGDGRGLVKAIDSAMTQEGISVQIIVVLDGDGYSDRGDRQCAESLGSPHRVLRLGPFGRPGPLRSVGAVAADGDFVAFLDDDDQWSVGKLREQTAALRETSLAIVGSDADKVCNDEQLGPYFGLQRDIRVNLVDGIMSNPFVTSSVVVHREKLRRVGYLPRGSEYRNVDDYVTWLKLLTLGDGLVMKERFVRYRVNSPGSLSDADSLSGSAARSLTVSSLLDEAAALSLSLSRVQRRVARKVIR